MKKHAAISHHSGGRHAYLPIKSPTANATAAQSNGARAAGDIAAICAAPRRLPRAVKCLACCSAGARTDVYPVGKVAVFLSCTSAAFVVGPSFVYLRVLCRWILFSNLVFLRVPSRPLWLDFFFYPRSRQWLVFLRVPSC